MKILFDAGQFAPKDRAAAFEAAFANAVSPTRVRFLTEHPASIQARVSGTQLHRDVTLVHTVNTSAVHERTEEHRNRTGPDRIAFVLFDGAPGYYEHHGYHRPLRRGNLFLTDLNAAFNYSCQGTGAGFSIQVERSQLEASVETIRSADHRLATSPLYGVVHDHLASLATYAPLLTSHQAREATAEATVALLKGLVASTSQDDYQRRAAVHDHLLGRVTLYVRMHAADPDINPDQIAAAHAISVRKLFQLWQSQPLSLNETIMQLRLEIAQRRLLAQPNLTIAAVARACGFVDASHFSRRFRNALGCTPTDWRALHRKHPPSRAKAASDWTGNTKSPR
ncbi:AraC family transcriptional regulator [Saccharopolyspora shandongensis]|uniref:AraC family transcriptional regulator n=1 Tax=Saccharopolyspora shandongensis TaxID=418495 RepID=UPI003400CBC2